MKQPARDAYLTTQVMTATPQKLQLMLIEAALRAAQQARRLWADEQHEAACEALIKCQSVVSELLGSVATGTHELSKKLSGVYVYVFRSLTEAHLERDKGKLDVAIRILEIERETWRQVCERFGSTRETSDEAGSAPAKKSEDRAAPSGGDAAATAFDSDRADASSDARTAIPPLPADFSEEGGISFSA